MSTQHVVVKHRHRDAEQRLQRALKRGILVDPEDEWLLRAYTWTIHNGYGCTWLSTGYRVQCSVYLHHCIVGQAAWQCDEVCHVNKNRLDNRRSNLVICKRSMSKLSNSNVVNAKHIMFDMRAKRWHVKIMRNGVYYRCMNLPTEMAAQLVREAWVALYAQHGDDTWMRLSGEWRITKRASLPNVSRHQRPRPPTC